MALKAGIVGLPNVGKSTLFNCLSSAKAQAANFPFCTIDAQMGQVSVPDERPTKLAEIVHHGMAGVAAALIADHHVVVRGHQVYHAALALVSPVDSHDGTI